MPIAEIDGARVYYEWSGRADAETMVLVNSLGSDLHIWDKVVPAFEQKYRVLRYDVRGHGLSSTSTRPYTIAQLGAELLGLFDGAEVGQAHVCGVSLGGMLGIWMGIHHPKRAGRLILANTAARIGTREGWDERIAAVRGGGMAPIAQLMPGRWFTERYRQEHPLEMEQICRMIEGTSSEGYIGCCEVLRDADLRGDLGRIDAPSLVIAGSADPATPPAGCRALHAALRNSEYLELDAAHISPWERGEEFAAAVLNFLHKGARG
jgi:3-oxoadipate enol-lactonase